MRIPRIREIVHWALVCAWLFAGWQGAAALTQAPDDVDRAAAIQAFASRVQRYSALRARLEEPLPPFDARRDSWSLLLTRRYLASAIRSARPHARQGDILTPPAAQLFRELIADAIDEVDVEALVDEDPEAADAVVDVVVNEPVPAWALRDVPEAVLRRLPALPEAIAYRVVGWSLILWDTHAEIVIDALPDALLIE